MANEVLDQEIGQMMEYRHLIKHKNPKIREIQNAAAANEIGRLFQEVGEYNDDGQREKGTDPSFFIPREKVPSTKVKHTTCAQISCTIREMKNDEHRTRMKVGGNKIKYDEDDRAATDHLETAKHLFNSVLHGRNDKLMTIDIANLHLMTPMKDYECLRISIKSVPTKIITETNLNKIVHHGWVCVEIQ